MPSPEPIVESCEGRLRGQTLDQCHAFLGIRYAQAERFEAPRPVEPWSGIVEATAFGPIAPQSDPDPAGPGYGIILERLPPPPAGAPRLPAPVESEDCQYLNVWTADLSPARPKPVMVWLHPGFFMLGSGASGNGAALAARGDVVVVSLNHRLNLFGYCHLDDIAPDFRNSGNAGQLDIVAALEWVQRNITRFGGDPSRVMVFGASGGGMKTAWLMASPRARDLLHRAGAQSGPCLRLMDRDDASAITMQLLDELGLGTGDANALRSMPADRLMRAYHRLRLRNRPSRFTHLASFAPVIDPDLLPRHPFDPDAAPGTRDIPLLLGWNREDMAFFPGEDMEMFDLDEAGALARLEPLAGARAAAIMSAYRTDDPAASPSRLYLRAFSDWSIGDAALAQAGRKAAGGGAPAFVYRFDHPSPAFGGRLGAVHSSETAYVFDQGGPFADRSDAARRLGERMRDAWVHFAATGDPNTPDSGLPHWPAFGPDGIVMRLDDAPQTITHPIPDAAAWTIA